MHRQQNDPPTSGPGGLRSRYLLQNLQFGAEDAKTGTHPGLSARGDGIEMKQRTQCNSIVIHRTVVFLYQIHFYL